MADNMPELEAIVSRLKRVERDNRRMKGAGLVVLLLAGSLLVMAQSQPTRTVVTNKLLIKDTKGKVRAELGVLDATVYLSFYDSGGAVLAGLGLNGDENKSYIDLSSKGQLNAMHLQVTSGKPTIELLDEKGFRTTLGVTSTVTPRTGEKHETSAASITMFSNDKDKTVVWQAPQN